MVLPIPSGRKSDAKIIKYRPFEVEGTSQLYELTHRMAGLLIQGAEYLRWKTRWENIPEELETQDSRDAYVSDLQLRLMQMVEFCAEVINCMETDNDTKASVRKVINNYNYAGTNPGTPMTEEELTEDMSNATENNPGCDHDILWAQCLALVQTTNRFIVDVFERIEAASNSVELADVASDVPIAGEVKNLVGINFVLELIQYWQNSIAEGYNAGYTTEYEQQLACDIFCACFDDCQITVERVFDELLGRVQSHLDMSSVSDIISFLETIFGVTLDGTIVTDMAFFAAWGSVKFAQFLFGSQFDGISLQLVMSLAVNDANNDWELLCEDCPDGLFYPIIADNTDCFGNGVNKGILTYVSGDEWDLELTADPTPGYTGHIKEHTGQLFAYRRVSGTVISSATLDDEDNCTFSGVGGGAINENQYLKELSLYTGTPQTIRIRFYTPTE